MAKRWINSVDVLVDGQGRLSIVLPDELLDADRLKVDLPDDLFDAGRLMVDVSTADIEAITGAGAARKTLADLDTLLTGIYGSLDSYGTPRLEMLRYDVTSGLYNYSLYEPWLKTIYDKLDAIHAILSDVHNPATHKIKVE